MPLIDGRYEVLAEQTLEEGRTQFHATAPDGTPLRIEWFDLPIEREAEFERYRRLLKRLKREGRAAVHDVVSRPGARYVAWLTPPDGSAAARDAELLAALEAEGYAPGAAEVIRAGGRGAAPQLYGLGFGGAAPPQAASVDQDALPTRPLRHVTEQRPSPLRWLRRLSTKQLSWALSGLLTLAALLLATAALRLHTFDRIVVVPDVVGQQAQSAADSLTTLALEVVPIAVASDERPGTVLALEPPAGTELRPGRGVQLSFALPRGQLAQVEVPNLLGSSAAVAEQALVAAGLRSGPVARIHASEPAGTVLAQSVEPGALTGSGEGIALLVSMGPALPQTFLPRLVGLDVAEARSLARLAGIPEERIVVDEIVANSGFPGEVLTQSLAPFIPVPVEQAVLRLVVQGGSVSGSPTGAPDLVGLPLAEAKRMAGTWNVSVASLANPGLPEGVVAQTPQPGGAGEGNELLLLVNAHPVSLSTDGVRAIVRKPEPRDVGYAWSIQPGISTQRAEVWATDMEGKRTLVERVTVAGGQILRGSWRTDTPGAVTFELLIAGVPYGQPLLVP